MKFSKYTEVMDEHRVVNQLQTFKHMDFQALIDASVLRQLMRKRQGKGGVYRIIDLFKDDIHLYTLVFNGILIESNGKIAINLGHLKSYKVKTWAWLFPRGFPQNKRQLAAWISYVGWVAYCKNSSQ